MSDKKTGSAKEMVKELAKQSRKVKLNERKEVIILKDTKFYRKDQVISPHVTFAEFLIKNGVAKESK